MKKIIVKVLYILSLLLVAAFAVVIIIDAISYNSMMTSAPFYVFVLVAAIEFLLPALLVFIVAKIIKRTQKG